MNYYTYNYNHKYNNHKVDYVDPSTKCTTDPKNYRKLQLRNNGEKGQRCYICHDDMKQQYIKLCTVKMFQNEWVCTDCKKKHQLVEVL
jgi:hypothetical protein